LGSGLSCAKTAQKRRQGSRIGYVYVNAAQQEASEGQNLQEESHFPVDVFTGKVVKNMQCQTRKNIKHGQALRKDAKTQKQVTGTNTAVLVLQFAKNGKIVF